MPVLRDVPPGQLGVCGVTLDAVAADAALTGIGVWLFVVTLELSRMLAKQGRVAESMLCNAFLVLWSMLTAYVFFRFLADLAGAR